MLAGSTIRSRLVAASCALFGLVLFSPAPSLAQEYEGQTLVSAELLLDTSSLKPGSTSQVGVLLNMAPGWHTYWKYPGDAGYPTTIDWQLPAGFEVGPLQWPLPYRVIEPGNIQVIAYKKQVLLTATLTVPEGLEGPQRLGAKVSWLVCKEICIPGSAELEVLVPTGSGGPSEQSNLFRATEQMLPQSSPPPFSIEWVQRGEELVADISGLPPESEVDFFPTPSEGQIVSHPVIEKVGPDASISISAHPPLSGLLVLKEGQARLGWPIKSGSLRASGGEPKPPLPTDQAVSVTPLPTPSLLSALFYGLIGGLILNLMPCVLPVISLKIFGFIKQAGDSPQKILRHGLAFTAGIFLWFLGLGAIISVLKLSGAEVTWAFQFQNPWFNFAIATIVFAFALNLFGVYEILLPGKAASAMSESGGDGYGGSFFQGIFATLLATPCTAPFLGTALGFAFSQSPFVIMAMFGSIAVGMALPYLLLSAQPAWLKFLPKPGAWMEKVRQFMGFPLIATLLWLLSVLFTQKGFGGVLAVSAFLLCLALSLWIYGAFCGPLTKPSQRAGALTVSIVITISAAWFFIADQFAKSSPPASTLSSESADGIQWIPFEAGTVQQLIGSNRTVFVDFTADWCISCKFNERTAIDQPNVREFVKENNIAMVKADWTNQNASITQALKAFGRVGVPFYVIYPAERPQDPIILPELLTQDIVLNGLKEATSEP